MELKNSFQGVEAALQLNPMQKKFFWFSGGKISISDYENWLWMFGV